MFLNRQLGVTVNVKIIMIMVLKVIKFATSKNLFFKSAMFPHENMHEYTWISPDGKTQNQIDHILIYSLPDVKSFRGEFTLVLIIDCRIQGETSCK